MSRHPAINTTAEQDFQALGLMHESNERPISSRKKRLVEADESEGTTDETLDEVSMKRTKRANSTQRRMWRKAKKKPKAKMAARKHNRKSSVQRMRKKHLKKATALRHGGAARAHTRLQFSNDTVSNMLESSQRILSSLDEEKSGNAIKAFAHMAILAEMLKRSLAYIAEDIHNQDADEDVSDLLNAAEVYAKIAEEAATIAKALKEGDDSVDEEGMADYFRESMAEVMNGLEFYSSITEEEDEDDDSDSDDDASDDDDDDDGEDEVSESEDDCDDEDEDEDEDEEDDEDDEDDDEEEEPKRKLPPFMKKK